jgi:hypothetical protein
MSNSPFILRKGEASISDLRDFVSPTPDIFVDAKTGSSAGDGLSWENAVNTMARGLAIVQTGGRVYFRGDIREEVTGSNLKFDIKIIGVGGQHHADEPSSAYHPGASVWRAPASPTATTPLIAVRGRGWEFHNILFDCPVDAAAVQLNSNASSGTDEYDASHARFYNCIFTSGYRGIQDNGGCHSVMIQDCIFRIISETGGGAIVNTSTSVRVPQYWRIENNFFAGNGASGGNELHIDAPLSGALIAKNYFGRVEGTAKYVDLTGGDDNIVTGNYMAGAYDTSDYVAGTNDEWFGNQTSSISFGTSGTNAAGVSIGVPEAAT